MLSHSRNSEGRTTFLLFRFRTIVEDDGMESSLVKSPLTSCSSVCEIVILGGELLSSPFP